MSEDETRVRCDCDLCKNHESRGGVGYCATEPDVLCLDPWGGYHENREEYGGKSE